jgi:hypothetical protein
MPSSMVGLAELEGFSFPAFASPESLTQATRVAERCRRALDWLAGIFGQRPAFTLIVAGPRDWQRVARIDLYGMPHAFPGLIVTGAEPPGFWHDYAVALMQDLPPQGRRRLTAVYGDPLQLGERFADLVIVHELAHLFHDYDEQTGLTSFPRLWLAELFANIALHGYIADTEPDQLASLQTVCQLTWQAPADRWAIRELDRMETSLAAGPLNYAWFQLRLIAVADGIWQAGNARAMRDFREMLTARELTDAQILATIHAIAPAAADALRRWPQA